MRLVVVSGTRLVLLIFLAIGALPPPSGGGKEATTNGEPATSALLNERTD